MNVVKIITILIFINFCSSLFSQGYNKNQVISEIESIIKPQYGNQYSVGIDFADSLMNRYSEGGYYKFEDPNHLLKGCVLFSAEDDSGSINKKRGKL